MKSQNISTPTHCLILITCGLLFFASSVVRAQNLKADYQFQGNLNSSVAGAPAMTNLTGSGANSFAADTVDGYARQSLRFPFNSGVAVNTNGVIPSNAYTIVILFRFDVVSGFRRVLDTSGGVSDLCGAYIQDARYEGEATNTTPTILQNMYIQAVIVREATGRIRAYRDGFLRVDLPNDQGCFQISGNVLRFFQDDNEVNDEASAGNVARIRLYDAPMTTAQVQMLDRPANAVGGGNHEISFSSLRDGNEDVYTMNVDGSNQRRLTNAAGVDRRPAWSPNGQKISFDSNRDGNFEVYVMNADGTVQTRLTNNAALDLQGDWFPSGTKMVFTTFRDNVNAGEIYSMNADGTNQVNLTQNNLSDDTQPTVSPDGTRIAFTSSRDGNSEIYVMNSDGSNQTRLTNVAANDSQPAWSPDGQKIAFTSFRDGNEEIYLMNADGSNQTNLTNSPVGEVKTSFSPDGSKIVFSGGTVSGLNHGEIYTMNLNGTGLVRLTFNSTHEFWADWKPQLINRRAPFDFDGDGKADVSVFRPSNGTWYLLNSTSGFTGVQFGIATDKLAPADFDGDGKTDIAVFRDGAWYLQRSQAGFTAVQFGQAGDQPQPADFDGDGKAELAVFRSGVWYVLNLSNNAFTSVQFGIASDNPVVADYDGDGRADPAVFRDGTWYLLRSTAGFTGVQFGIAGDKPVSADFDGDGRADQAVYRGGNWFMLGSQAGFSSIQFGLATDLPAPADFDGDGRADQAVFRDGAWYLNRSQQGFISVQFGAAADKPIPNAFVP